MKNPSKLFPEPFYFILESDGLSPLGRHTQNPEFFLPSVDLLFQSMTKTRLTYNRAGQVVPAPVFRAVRILASKSAQQEAAK